MILRRTASVLGLMALLPLVAAAETIRGPIRSQQTVSSTQDSETTTVGIEDLISVSLGDNARFINGIEVDISVPPAARQYRNLLALFVYKRVYPAPSDNVADYSGTRVAFVVLPPTAKSYVVIPIRQGALQGSPDTITLDSVIRPEDFPVILTILPVAKGLPASISDSTFGISISPVVADRGLLLLDITDDGKPPAQPFTLSIDDEQVAIDREGYALSTGLHHLQITSTSYKDLYRTFGIDKGGTTRLALQLQSLVPQLTFEAPDNAELFLDGQKLDPIPRAPMVVSAGEHTVIMRLGNYSLTKKFTVEQGKSYKVSLFLDILVQEN
ncbi:MAG TPA: hypothetical protein VMV68_02430 [Spirochaetia bacterium]|nr:hypothetical protein [Spirochaetia bacterium]